MKSHIDTCKGVVYVSVGNQSYAQMCLASIASLRYAGYSGPVLVITDKKEIEWPTKNTLIHLVPSSNSPLSSRRWKTMAGLLSPFAKNIYLDSDILVTSQLDEAWSRIEDDKIGLALDKHPTLSLELAPPHRWPRSPRDERIYTINMCGPEFPFYNGGVIFWKKSRVTTDFFSRWNHEWKIYSGRDQFALARALVKSGTHTVCLPRTYNCRSRLSPTLADAICQRNTFVHFWDNKLRFHDFFKQIQAWATFDRKTRCTVAKLLANREGLATPSEK